MANLLRLWRFLPVVVGLVLFLKRRGKKDVALDDDDRAQLEADIEDLTTLSHSGESDDRKDIARETAERLRAALARERVNQKALHNYNKARDGIGDPLTAKAATDKRYDRKLRDLENAAGKLAGG